MFQRITRNIVPPEMAALLLPIAGTGKVKGYLFRRSLDGLYYGANGVNTILRSKARIYSWRSVVANSRNHWNWGHKSHGKWVVTYE